MNNSQRPPFIFLEASACSGDSISLLNSVAPSFTQLITELVEVRFWNTVMFKQGEAAIQELYRTANQGDFILAVEGAIATASNGLYAVPFYVNGKAYTTVELIKWLAPKAKYIIAVGTCAAFGGPSAANPNLSGSYGVHSIISEPVINVSGCPVNPDWFLGTLSYVIKNGMPELDSYQRPRLFYNRTVHSACQRRSFYDTKEFAEKLGDRACMFSLGCMGPTTGSDCPYRFWNEHLNWPVKASTPCIGCTRAGFPDQSTPFYTPLPRKRTASEETLG